MPFVNWHLLEFIFIYFEMEIINTVIDWYMQSELLYCNAAYGD
jgi:hypothetical protein